MHVLCEYGETRCFAQCKVESESEEVARRIQFGWLEKVHQREQRNGSNHVWKGALKVTERVMLDLTELKRISHEYGLTLTSSLEELAHGGDKVPLSECVSTLSTLVQSMVSQMQPDDETTGHRLLALGTACMAAIIALGSYEEA